MRHSNSINTIFSRSVILIINFLIVIFTTQIWGVEGRGEIALVMLNIALLVIGNNVFSGSTIAYHATKYDKNELLSIAFIGSFIFSLLGSILLAILFKFEYFKHFLIIGFLNSIVNAITLYLLGKKNIKLYNIFLVLPPIAILIYTMVLYYIFKVGDVNAYFYSNYLAYITIIIIGFILLFKNENFYIPKIPIYSIKKIVNYGFSIEVSNLFQFLNYRVAFFFIVELLGFEELGLFSVAVAISEAMWIISRSSSIIHFSYVLNSNNEIENIKKTSILAKQNFLIGIGLSFILYFIPSNVFTFIFGNAFEEVKTITIYLIPGIIAIGSSNLIGHYFAGIGNVTVLKNKSYIGFIATIISALILIPKYKLFGACITLNISHIASSLYLFYNFQIQKKNNFAKS